MADIGLVKALFFISQESHDARVLLWRVKGIQGVKTCLEICGLDVTAQGVGFEDDGSRQDAAQGWEGLNRVTTPMARPRYDWKQLSGILSRIFVLSNCTS